MYNIPKIYHCMQKQNGFEHIDQTRFFLISYWIIFRLTDCLPTIAT